MARLAVVMGDPTGIGPEVLVRALAEGLPSEVLLIGDAAVWDEAQRVAGVALPARPADRPGLLGPGGVPFLDLPPPDRTWTPGQMSPAAGRASARWLEAAVRLALDGLADAVVFAALNKQAIMRAGFPVRDEYDLCAALAKVEDHDEMNVIPHPAGTTAAGDRGRGDGGYQRLGPASRRSHLPPCAGRRPRRGGGDVPRSGADRDQAARV